MYIWSVPFYTATIRESEVQLRLKTEESEETKSNKSEQKSVKTDKCQVNAIHASVKFN